MKKLFMLLIPITLIFLGGCNNKLYKWTVISKHETTGFWDITYIVAQLEDWSRISIRNIELIVWDNVMCSKLNIWENKCYLVINQD